MGLIDSRIGHTAAGKHINHRNLYLLGIGLVLCGLSWSNVLMSIGQFVLFGNWLLELNFQRKFNKLFSNKVALIALAFFLFHLIALLWTDDLAYALKDIRIKLPLLILILTIATSRELSKKELSFLFSLFLISVLLTTFASLFKLLGLTTGNIQDKRELSIRISHIRYGLIIAFASISSFYYLIKGFSKKWLYLSIGVYFFFCLLLFELYTGLLTFFAVTLLYLINKLFTTKSRAIKYSTAVVLLLLIITPSLMIYGVYRDFYRLPQKFNYDQEELESYTISGNKYYHDTNSPLKENAYYIWRYISFKELKEEWNSRSALPYDSTDAKGQIVQTTLIRYLSSKGLKKDSVGMSKLSKEDISAIESGIANTYYNNHNKIQSRIFSTLYELHNYKNYQIADGFSLAMRLEYWKIGLEIIQNNMFLGVGTGDIDSEFDNMYLSGKSNLLQEENWRRTHNQYLSTWIQLGFPGLILLLFMLFYPLQFKRNRENILYISFLTLISLSMLTEDTLETQAGATLFSIFYALLLFNPKP